MSEEVEWSHITEANKSTCPNWDDYNGVFISLGCSDTAGSEIDSMGDND